MIDIIIAVLFGWPLIMLGIIIGAAIVAPIIARKKP